MRNSTILMVVAAATAAFATPIAKLRATRTSIPATPAPEVFPDGFILSEPDNEKTGTTKSVPTVTVPIIAPRKEKTGGWAYTEEDRIHDQAEYEADVADFKEAEEFFKLRQAQQQRKEAEELDPYYSEGTTDEEIPNRELWEEYMDMLKEAQWNRPAEKRDSKRKHGVVCNIL